jgi:predicted deacylase
MKFGILLLLLFAASLFLQSCVRRNDVPAAGNEAISRRVAEASPVQGSGVLSRFIAGSSVLGRPIDVTRIGSGNERALVILGSIHGEEANTYALAMQLLEKYRANPALIPRSMTLYFVPLVNPDGHAAGKRLNAHDVDLNRNFPTADWQEKALDMHSGMIEGLGGARAGSEPEVEALVRLFTVRIRPSYREVIVLSLHSASPPAGYIQPAYVENGVPEAGSLALAETACKASGYNLLRAWKEKSPITGELIRFCAEQSLFGMDLELPTYDPPDVVPRGKKESSFDSVSKAVEALTARK